jgi:hypothetical protein
MIQLYRTEISKSKFLGRKKEKKMKKKRRLRRGGGRCRAKAPKGAIADA